MKRPNEDVLLGAATVVASALFGVCFWRHVCMSGHAAHPPYSAADVALDYIWVGLLGAVSIAEVLRRSRNRFLVAGAVVLVSTSRLVLGGGGGFLLPIEFALLCGLFGLFAGRRLLLDSVILGRSGRLGRGLFLVGFGGGLLVAVAAWFVVIRIAFMAIPAFMAVCLALIGLMMCKRSVKPPAQLTP